MVRVQATIFVYVAGLILAFCVIPQVQAQGNSPFFVAETGVSRKWEIRATFECEDARAAPETDEPQRKWIDNGSVAICGVSGPDLGVNDKALALKLSHALCHHSDLQVCAQPDSSAFNGAEWSFAKLSWKTGS
ncbi:hypothetical protein ANTHELSMS3_03086 [Antarctobacter heliothermus]|uniref:Uncharacterized protein n=2 Tax=Antarctobacter heliothermus TaxID=74033 RepID=A0A222E6V8_9RHOB|nr:hypothetical protein ANTHELSMS3_03086 [Antarctobacter heliothermus]